MSEPKSKAKPFDISKWVVWDAYEKVKANQGAAGVDGESIAEFEKNLKGNLYKLWNRMSSGTYFPPPVRAVEIPKKAGGIKDARRAHRGGQNRPNGGPHATWSRKWSRCSTLTPTAIVLGVRRDALAACRQRCWKFDWVSTLISGRSSTASPRPLAEGGVEAHGPALGPPLRGAVAESAAPEGGRHFCGTRSWDPPGFCDLAPAGQPESHWVR